MVWLLAALFTVLSAFAGQGQLTVPPDDPGSEFTPIDSPTILAIPQVDVPVPPAPQTTVVPPQTVVAPQPQTAVVPPQPQPQTTVVAPETAVVPPTNTEEFKDCDSKLSVALGKLLESDTKGILGLQYKLTTLKLTKKLLGTSNKTIEDKIRSDKARINALNAEDPTVLSNLSDVFGDNAGDTHKEILKERVRALKAESADANYFSSAKRVSNQDISTYLMMDQMDDEKSDVDDTDIAIAWFMNKVSEQTAQNSGRNSGVHNMTLMSTQLARNLGAIRGLNALSASEVDSQIAAAEASINEFLTGAAASIKQSIPECFKDDKFKGTESCDIAFLSKELSEYLMNIENITPYISSMNRASISMSRSLQNSRPQATVRPTSKGPTTRTPARAARRADPKRQTLNEAVSAVYKMGDNQRFRCPDGKSVPFRTTDLNNGRGNYRLSILVGGQLHTVKRELPSDKQISCVSRQLTHQCFGDVNASQDCFY